MRPPESNRQLDVSQLDLFDYKPALQKLHGTELPDSVRNGQRITGMTSGQKSFPCVAPMFKFARLPRLSLRQLTAWRRFATTRCWCR